MLDNPVLSLSKGQVWWTCCQKMVTPAAKREAVVHLLTMLPMSERRAYMVVGADRTPQETDHLTGIPDASIFCITGALGFPLFMR